MVQPIGYYWMVRRTFFNFNSLSVQGQRLSKMLVLLSNHHVDTVGLVHSQTGS